MFEFKINHREKHSKARTATLQTPHGTINTPVFMPVGTKATVKTLSNQNIQDLGAKIILANSYHLYLRPGDQMVKKMGKLHDWMNYHGPILTDSGGFQIFSLGQEKDFSKNAPFKTSVKIDENGVEFKSHLDGSNHYITPEKAMQIQHNLGADIIMAFDECAPAASSKEYFEKAMERTHHWIIRCIREHQKLCKKSKEKRALFGIVQGGLYPELRVKSAQFIDSLDLPGNAIGGLSVGESRKEMLKMIETTIPHLSENKPRYLMGVGTPEDLLECVERGIDMFDCVHPTRMARHGAFWNENGRHSIKNEKFKTDKSPLQKNCQCQTCKNHSKSYLRHLMVENEILGLNLMSIHNLHFLLNLMKKIRQSINKDQFPSFKQNFLKKFTKKQKSSSLPKKSKKQS